MQKVSVNLKSYCDDINKYNSSDIFFRLVDINIVKPSEKINTGRAKSLLDKISIDGYWYKPILVEENNKIVMDGHHRLWVAKQLGLARIPCLLTTYENPNLSLTTWTENQKIHPEVVFSAGLSGDLLDYKTSKHTLKIEQSIPTLNLEDLR